MQISIILTIFLLVIALLQPKSKFWAVVWFVFMWSLWGGNTWNGDYDAYADFFADPAAGGFEIGYVFLNQIVGLFTDNYQVFLALISCAILSVTCYLILKTSPYPALFSAVYFFLFLGEFVFNRDYIVTTLVLMSLWGFYKANDIKLFIISVILGLSVHVFSLVYLLLIPALRTTRLSLKRSLVWIIPSNILMLFTPRCLNIYNGSDIVSRYEAYSRLTDSMITPSAVVLMLLVCMVVLIVKKVYKNRNMPFPIILLANINVASLVFVGVFGNIPYAASRYFRFLFVIELLLFTLLLEDTRQDKSRRKVYVAFAVFLGILMLYFSQGSFNYTVEPLYRCNLLWGAETVCQ